MTQRLTAAAVLATTVLLGCSGKDRVSTTTGVQRDAEPASRPAPVPDKPTDPAELTKNLRSVARAVHNFASQSADGGTTPGNIVSTADGRQLLSWRVSLLTVLEPKLYAEFKTGEPWDSEHNKKLVGRMPEVFKVPGRNAPPGHTYYRSFIAPPGTPTTARPWLHSDVPKKWAGTEWTGGGQSLNRFPDGTVNTLMVVEAAEAVPWTKPDELVYDGKRPLPPLGDPATGRFLAAFGDARVVVIDRQSIDEKTLRALITVAGGEVVTPPGYDPSARPSGSPASTQR